MKKVALRLCFGEEFQQEINIPLDAPTGRRVPLLAPDGSVGRLDVKVFPPHQCLKHRSGKFHGPPYRLQSINHRPTNALRFRNPPPDNPPRVLPTTTSRVHP